MNQTLFDDYSRTVIDKTWGFSGRLETHKDHLVNAVMGLVGEAGEVANVLKKSLYHLPRDYKERFIDELGDVWYYLIKTHNLLEIPIEDALHYNQQKLMARYPDRFAKEVE